MEAIRSSCQRTIQFAREGNFGRFEQPYRAYQETTLGCRNFAEYARSQWIADNDFNIQRGGCWYT